MHPQLARIFVILGAVLTTGCASNHAAQHSEGHDWSEEPHHLSFLVANTIASGEDTAPTIGVDYEYRVSELIGLGGVIEYAGEDLDATTLLAVADIHLTPELIIQTGPGVEFVDSEQEAVLRIGMLYEFLMDGYTLSPQLHYDWTSSVDSVVLALAVGWGF